MEHEQKLDIRKIREKRQMTQEELSTKSNVSRSIINQLESGKLTNTTTVTLSKLAKAMNCRITDLFISI